jgi:hypothetical protein
MLFATAQPRGQLVQNIRKLLACPAFQSAFPDDPDPPAFILQFNLITYVNFPVACDFGVPEFRACGRPFEKMTVMPMPETAMGENNGMIFRENNVGLT